MKYLNLNRWNLLFYLLLISVCGCKKEKEVSPAPYDPNQPVTITDFSPHKGGAKTRMIIYGSNFGIDPSIVSVKIGGKDAKIINVKGDCLYCITPSMCYEGTVELKIGDSESVIASQKYEYEKKRLVSTLCGYIDELGKGEVMSEGHFDELEKIDYPTWLSFDPKEPDVMYCIQDDGGQNNKPMLRFDLKEEYMTTALTLQKDGVNRLRTIDWSITGDSMIISSAKGEDGAASNIFVTRENNFSDMHRLTTSKGCQSSVVHRETGDLYFNRFQDGAVFRYNFTKYGANNNNAENTEQLFTIQDKDWEFNFVQHPSGDYMYLLVVNQHYIMRSNFDRKTNKYTTPYIVCGGVSQAGYQDLVGTNARLNCPYQGVFVKNPDYAGRADEYDFYFTDRENHCVRILTPNGVVSTFAGRGSVGVNANAYGYIDGDLREEARFNRPSGIAYDERNNAFYITDIENHRIRKISFEYSEETDSSENPNEGTEPDASDEETEENNN